MVCGLQFRFLITAKTFESTSNVKIYLNRLKISLWLVTQTPLSFFDQGVYSLIADGV